MLSAWVEAFPICGIISFYGKAVYCRILGGLNEECNTHYFDMSSLMGYAYKAAACLEDVFTLQ